MATTIIPRAKMTKEQIGRFINLWSDPPSDEYEFFELAKQILPWIKFREFDYWWHRSVVLAPRYWMRGLSEFRWILNCLKATDPRPIMEWPLFDCAKPCGNYRYVGGTSIYLCECGKGWKCPGVQAAKKKYPNYGPTRGHLPSKVKKERW
jgi:hypothetical protein